jgi:hypothetical protein
MLVVIAALLSLLVTACNGDDEGDPTATAGVGGTPIVTSTAAATAEPSPPAGTGEAAFTYVAEGAVWIARPPSAPQRFADAAPCGQFPLLQWSPDGERLACLSLSAEPPVKFVMWGTDGAVLLERDLSVDAPRHLLHWSPDGRTLALDTGNTLAFLDRAGAQIGEVDNVGEAGFAAAIDLTSPLWSQDGSRFAFWSEDAAEARVFSVRDGTTIALPFEGRPIAWVLDDQAMLVAENYVPLPAGAGPGFPDYEVRLVYLDGRDDFQRRPELDRGRQLWLSPDRETIAFLTPELAVSLLDIASGEVRPIEGSHLGYPSDGIPPDNVRFTDDGSAIVWTDDLPATINRADVVTATLQKLTTLPQLAHISPDGERLVYSVFDEASQTTTVYLADIDGSNSVELEQLGSANGTWRPAGD